jgi:hypothetical protein
MVVAEQVQYSVYDEQLQFMHRAVPALCCLLLRAREGDDDIAKVGRLARPIYEGVAGPRIREG